MVPRIARRLSDIIHIKSRKDLPHLGVVLILVFGIGLGVYLALQPQIFNKKAAEDSMVDLKFIPDNIQVDLGGTYEAKIAINPKGERVTAASIHISYDPQSISILGTENSGFLPIELKKEDDYAGNLLLIYGSTIESQAIQPGMLSTIQFKVLNPYSSTFQVKTDSEVSVSSKEGNVLNVFPKLVIEPVNPGAAPGGEVKYPNNLLLEKAFFASSEPVVRDIKEILTPKPKIKKPRVRPEFSIDYATQLGSDIFISPIVALNQVIEESVGEVLGK